MPTSAQRWDTHIMSRCKELNRTRTAAEASMTKYQGLIDAIDADTQDPILQNNLKVYTSHLKVATGKRDRAVAECAAMEVKMFSALTADEQTTISDLSDKTTTRALAQSRITPAEFATSIDKIEGDAQRGQNDKQRGQHHDKHLCKCVLHSLHTTKPLP